MKIIELFEEEQHISTAMKALNKEFKDIANRYKLSIVAGMGWPQITKDGAWMGGGIGPLRGITDDQAMLSFDKRMAGFIRTVARRLEDLIKEGHTVKVARGGQRSVHQEVAEAGRVEEQLLANLQTEVPPGVRGRGQMPTVVWYVSAPAGVSTTSFINISGSLYQMPGYRGYGTTKTFRLPSDLAFEKALMSWLNKVKRLPTPELRRFVFDLLVTLKEQGHALKSWSPQPPASLEDLLKDASLSFSFNKTRVAGRGSTILDISTILPVLKKHGFTGEVK